MERFEIFTICRRPPVLQTDASVGMMKRVVRVPYQDDDKTRMDKVMFNKT